MENNHKIKIVIADDHAFYLDGLKGFFEGNDVYEIVGEAFNGEELIRKVSLLQPQIVLTDLRMPLVSGAKAIRTLVQKYPSLKCIVLTNYNNDHSIIEALEAGAKGYITKNMPGKELFLALDQVCRGYPYYCLTTSAKMIRLLGKSIFNPYATDQIPVFSLQEKKIIQLICCEKNNHEMADILFLSIRTIENNRLRIYKKMEVKSSAGVAIFAIKHGIYFLEDI